MSRSLFVGVDVGSSAVKTVVFDGSTREVVGFASQPGEEMRIMVPGHGFAEQDPQEWWNHFVQGFRQIVHEQEVDTAQITAIGISYQMHGLVLVDKNSELLRPAIIWCDSRAAALGAEAFEGIGKKTCLDTVLNSPGNFTAAKLAWVQKHEPSTYEQIHKILLPGDYLALRLCGQCTTTPGGLSEGILWNFRDRCPSVEVLAHFGFDKALIPELVPSIGEQASISPSVAAELGLRADTLVTYRAGDVPNSALSVNALNPGEVATTAGTSAVVFAITDADIADPLSRVNTFLHANDTEARKRNGVLLCINGAGNLYSWMKRTMSVGAGVSYNQMNALADKMPIGSDGLRFFPFGNGAERLFGNKNLSAGLHGLNFNQHTPAHIVRAGLEGIVFAVSLGFDLYEELRIPINQVRAAHGNLFLNETFGQMFADVTGAEVSIYQTSGAEAAARAAALGCGFFASESDAFGSVKLMHGYQPRPESRDSYRKERADWRRSLHSLIRDAEC